jgi:hypothetical protein
VKKNMTTEALIVKNAERRTSSSGNEFLMLELMDSRKISFFNESDVLVDIPEGATIQCDIQQKGRFYNGKNLKLLSEETQSRSPIPIASQLNYNPRKPSPSQNTKIFREEPDDTPIPIARQTKNHPIPVISSSSSVHSNLPPLHQLSVEKLEQLYDLEAQKNSDETTLAQISSHIRFARLEVFLNIFLTQFQGMAQNFSKRP